MTRPFGRSTNSDRGVIRLVKSCPDPCRLRTNRPVRFNSPREGHAKRGYGLCRSLLVFLVGHEGFEPTTS